LIDYPDLHEKNIGQFINKISTGHIILKINVSALKWAEIDSIDDLQKYIGRFIMN